MKGERITDEAALTAAFTLKKYCDQHDCSECRICLFHDNDFFCRVNCMPYSYDLTDCADEKRLKEEL